MTTPLDIANAYIARGWTPLPVPYRTKKPILPDWQNFKITADTASQYFNGQRQNVGVLMGAASRGLSDVDLDSAEGIAVSHFLLPRTGAIFGRASRRDSHWLYYTGLAQARDIARIEYRDPLLSVDDKPLLELRIGGGGKGAQTIFPGSVHESGEAIDWEAKGDPAAIDGEELQQQVARVAAAALLARYWPGEGGRHKAALALGGMLARAGWSVGAIKLFAEAVARAAADPECKDRVTAAESSSNAIAAGKQTFGFRTLATLIHERAAKQAAEWLGYHGAAEAADSEPADSEPAGPLILTSAQFVAHFTPPDYLIDGITQRRFCYSFTAPTGAGKTAVALRLGAHVALGAKIGEREVAAGRVLYFAGENPDDVRMRWIAMAEHIEFDPNSMPVNFIAGAFKIADLEARIRQEVESIGELALIIVDTSAAYFGGDQENDNVQMGAHARQLRKLTTMPGGPCVIVPCHPVKNATADNLIPRGGGAFLAEMDGNLTAHKTDALVTVHWQGKFRGPDFAPLPFEIFTATSDRLRDSKNRHVPTAIAKPLSEGEQRDAAAKGREDEDQMLVAILNAEGDTTPTGIAERMMWTLKDGRPNKMRGKRVADRLKSAKLVTTERGALTLTERGTKAARKVQSNHELAGARYG